MVQPATLGIASDPQKPVFVVGKGELEGKGGDETRLAWEELIRQQGAGRLYGQLTELHKYAQPPQTGILLPLRR